METQVDSATSDNQDGQVTCEIDDKNNPYYFESDHTALRCNADYCSLLKTLCRLESQRIKALQDIDQLYKCQETALKDPIAFVEKLQRGEDLNFPKRQTVAEIPAINWEAYTSKKDLAAYYAPRHMTRKKRPVGSNPVIPQSSSSSSSYIDDVECETIIRSDGTRSQTVVRGRLKDENKPVSFNQLWSVEEQKRLEELLVKHPPEEIESRRWQKIAAALGNRTTQQVASRVQKYFIKLAKAGLPVPGRTPNLTSYTRKTGHRHQRYNRFYHQSTFLRSRDLPVYMSDNDDEGSLSIEGSNSFTTDPAHFNKDFSDDDDDDDDEDDDEEFYEEYDNDDDDDDIPAELRDTPEYKELMKLKTLKMSRIGPKQGHTHKCTNCHRPLTNRWRCIDCQEHGLLIDLCQLCIESSFEHPVHQVSHRLKPVSNPTTSRSRGGGHSYVDNDYQKFSGDYNYLDPNYMPAS
ncbi:ZZ-type zinc finger-containing protein 3-like [Argonauta hians]